MKAYLFFLMCMLPVLSFASEKSAGVTPKRFEAKDDSTLSSQEGEIDGEHFLVTVVGLMGESYWDRLAAIDGALTVGSV